LANTVQVSKQLADDAQLISDNSDTGKLLLRKPKRDPLARLQRRRRLARRRTMLSFGPPEDKHAVHRWIGFLRDLSDEDVENSCGDCSGMNEEAEHTTLCGETVTLLGIANVHIGAFVHFATVKFWLPTNSVLAVILVTVAVVVIYPAAA